MHEEPTCYKPITHKESSRAERMAEKLQKEQSASEKQEYLRTMDYVLYQRERRMRSKGASEHSIQLALKGEYEYMKAYYLMEPVGFPSDSQPKPVTKIPGELLSGLETRPINWLWPNRIPLGKITILEGDPAVGKSLARQPIKSPRAILHPNKEDTMLNQTQRSRSAHTRNILFFSSTNPHFPPQQPQKILAQNAAHQRIFLPSQMLLANSNLTLGIIHIHAQSNNFWAFVSSIRPTCPKCHNYHRKTHHQNTCHNCPNYHRNTAHMSQKNHQNTCHNCHNCPNYRRNTAHMSQTHHQNTCHNCHNVTITAGQIASNTCHLAHSRSNSSSEWHCFINSSAVSVTLVTLLPGIREFTDPGISVISCGLS